MPTSLIRVALVAALLAGPAAADDMKPLRISTTLKPLLFQLTGGSGALHLGPSTSVIVGGTRPAGPWVVAVERGDVALHCAPGAPPGSSVGGALASIRVKQGTAVYWRAGEAGAEGGLLSSGAGELAQVVAAGTPPRVEELSPGRVFKIAPPAPIGWSDVKTAPRLEALAKQTAAGEGDALKVPLTLPPSKEDVAKPHPGLKKRPLAMGTVNFTLPGDVPLRTTEKFSPYRERLMVTVPGRGMGGPAVYVAHAPAEPGRVQNLVWSGGAGLVRFAMDPDWTVTLAPGSLLELEGVEELLPNFHPPAKLRLHQGLMVVEAASPEVNRPPDVSMLGEREGFVLGRDIGPVAGHRVMLYATPGAEGSAVDALARARALLRDAHKDLPSPGNEASIGLVAQLPAPSRAIAQYAPVQVDVPGREQMNISVLGAPPEKKDVPLPAMEIVMRDARGTLLPVALLMPVELPADPGADAEDMQVLMVPRNAATSGHLRDVVDRYRQAFVVRAPDQDFDPGPYIPYALATVALMLVLRMYRRPVLRILASTFGIGKGGCPRCGQALERLPVAEVNATDVPEAVFQLLDVDTLIESKQGKARQAVAEWAKSIGPIKADYKYQLAASWCGRCQQGAISAEMWRGGHAQDEAEVEFFGMDTLGMLQALHRPAAPPPPPPPAAKPPAPPPPAKKDEP